MGNTEHFQTKVPPPLAERIRKAAERAGLKPSQWIRRTIERTLDGAMEDDRTEGGRRPTVAERQIDREAFSDHQAKLRRQAAAITGKPAPNEPQGEEEGERFFLPHLVQEDGECAGGCSPESDPTCLVGPTDPRRTGKRARRG